MKLFLLVSLLASSISGAAEAATRTFQAVGTNLSFSGSDALSMLGADPNATEIIYTWVFNNSADPVSGPNSINAINNLYEAARFPYISFSFSIGGVEFVFPAATVPNFDNIFIRDTYFSSGVFRDTFEVSHVTEVAGPNGTTLIDAFTLALDSNMDFFGRSSTAPAFSGLYHPTADELNSAGVRYSYLSMFDSSNNLGTIFASDVVYTELTPIPLPASLPLLMVGIASIGLWKRRQTKT